MGSNPLTRAIFFCIKKLDNSGPFHCVCLLFALAPPYINEMWKIFPTLHMVWILFAFGRVKHCVIGLQEDEIINNVGLCMCASIL